MTEYRAASVNYGSPAGLVDLQTESTSSPQLDKIPMTTLILSIIKKKTYHAGHQNQGFLLDFDIQNS